MKWHVQMKVRQWMPWSWPLLGEKDSELDESRETPVAVIDGEYGRVSTGHE